MSSLRDRLFEATGRAPRALRAGPGILSPDMFYKMRPDCVGRFDYPRDLAPAAVLVPIVARAAGARVLLTERAGHMPSHPGDIVFPGGGQSVADATLVDTALRESEEEIGLPRRSVDVVGFLDPHPTAATLHLIHPVVALVEADHPLAPDPREVAAVIEVPLDFIREPRNQERLSGDFGAGMVHDVPLMTFQGRRIWGPPAFILFELAAILGGTDP